MRYLALFFILAASTVSLGNQPAPPIPAIPSRSIIRENYECYVFVEKDAWNWNNRQMVSYLTYYPQHKYGRIAELTFSCEEDYQECKKLDGFLVQATGIWVTTGVERFFLLEEIRPVIRP